MDNTVPLWQALLIAGVPSLAGFAGVFITVVTSRARAQDDADRDERRRQDEQAHQLALLAAEQESRNQTEREAFLRTERRTVYREVLQAARNHLSTIDLCFRIFAKLGNIPDNDSGWGRINKSDER